ncbi:hypothetical protein ACSNN7_01580 [Micromonospora sp. URMC 105]|uniref:hypothetical protein n=1 Tax=Micromonospora sp. URMC 105 TaxID=3423413 RepID=UPI003F197AC6
MLVNERGSTSSVTCSGKPKKSWSGDDNAHHIRSSSLERRGSTTTTGNPVADCGRHGGLDGSAWLIMER